MAGNVGEVSDANFEKDVLQSAVPVLVDFWAPWCGPCKSIAPVLEDVAKELTGKVRIVKMNVDEFSKTPASYNVMAIPSLILFKGGKVVDRVTGAIPRDQLISFLNKAM